MNTRSKSPPRAEALFKAMRPKPNYSTRTLEGNWVEDRTECPKGGTLYFPPKEVIDYEKMKPEVRRADSRQNKLNGTQGYVHLVMKHDSHDGCGNYATTNDVVYRHLPKPLCGPPLRKYSTVEQIYIPQPDLTKFFGNLTEWGLRTYKKWEWACTNVSDYANSQYDDSYVAPQLNQYLKTAERKARNSAFTKTFQYKMTKPVVTPKKKR